MWKKCSEFFDLLQIHYKVDDREHDTWCVMWAGGEAKRALKRALQRFKDKNDIIY